MNMNPFLNQSLLNAPLQQEPCQRIQYMAWSKVMYQPHEAMNVPQSLNVARLRMQRRRFGRASSLVHPADVEKMFAGVTLALYHTIERLYCSRHERSIPTVWRLVNAMAQYAKVLPVTYEAVWSICLFLEERRLRATATLLERRDEQWWIASLDYERHTILCLFDPAYAQVLAFHTSDSQEMPVYERVLYDAVVSQRRPTSDTPAGLSWSLPRHLFTQDVVPPTFREACIHLGIALIERQERHPFVQTLYEGWNYEYRQRNLPARRWAEAFDHYLDRVYGYGPIRVREERDEANMHLIGYNQDPSWLFPALRLLLPPHEGYVIENGAVLYDELHYTDELLSYWTESPVTVRRSFHTEACVWVYLSGEIMCDAMARELRRHDGTYRLARRGG